MANNTVNRRVNLYINGKEAGKDIKSIKNEMQKLVNEQARMKIGSDEYVVHARRIRELRGVMDEHNRQLQATKKGWLSLGGVADGFNKYFGMLTAGIASVTGVVLGFKKLSEQVAKMDDTYSDVSKTTNLTREEVVALNEEFKKMDTRTSREELNKLATDAGKLGISGQKDILDFVDAGNQINVALGDDLGEDAIKNIGKITDVFKASTEELRGMDLKQQMLSIGSAINELGQSSTASESYLVDFAQRLGGVASQAGISIQNILGFASALDQSGEKTEMAATAFQNFIMKLMADPAKFAKLAGQDVKQFTDLLKTDTNAAIVQVLTSLNSRGGFQALIPIFNEMGLDGTRAVGVLSNLAGKIGKVTEAQEIANKGFADATSITNEYGKKNTNLQAQLEKSRKAFNEQALELGEKLGPALVTSTNGFTHLIKALTKAPEFMKENRTLLVALAGALTTYAALSAGAAIQTGFLSAKTSVLSGIEKAYNVITGETIMQKERETVANQVYVEQLSKAITKEQAAALQKQGLSKTSKEYSEQLQAAALRNLSATEAEVTALRKEVPALSASIETKKKAYMAASNLVEQRRYEAYWAGQSGNAVKIATAEKKLEEAVDKKSAASKIYMSTTREFHSKKIQLETAAQKVNTLSTQINTAADTASAAAKQVLFSVTTRLTTAMRALWASMKANPMGWILSLVSLGVTAYQMFADKAGAAAEAQREFAVESKKESVLIDMMFDRLGKATKGTDEYAAAKKAIMDKYGIYLQQLGDENTALEDQVKAREAVKKAIEAELKAKVHAKHLEQYVTDSAEKEIEAYQKIKSGLTSKLGKEQGESAFDSFKNAIESGGNPYAILKEYGIKAFEDEANGWFSKTYGQWISQINDSKRILENQKKDLDSFFKPADKSKSPVSDKSGSPATDNSAVLKEIALLADKQKLQGYIISQDPEIKAAAEARLSALGNENQAASDLIKSKEKELELIQSQPANTKEEIAARNLKVKALQDEINGLKNLGTAEQDEKEKKAKEFKDTRKQKEEELAKAIMDIYSDLRMYGLNEAEKEILQTEKKYSELLSLCRKYSLDSTEVMTLREQEMDQLAEKFLDDEVTKTLEAQEKIENALMSSSEREKENVRQKYAELIKLAEEYGIDTTVLKQKMNDELDKMKPSSGADLFGMTQEDWDEMQGKITMALDIAGQMTDIWGQVNQIQANKEKKELQDYEKSCNKKKELLNKQLNSGRISQEQYNARVSQLDADLEKKKTEMARKQAKRDKAVAITNAIINTASAVVQALKADPPLGFIFAALAGAIGAAQTAVIMSQPLPEFASGGMTDGAKMYIAGEAGREWISPNWMLEDPVTGPLIKRLELVRTGSLAPEMLAPAIPDFKTMTSVPMYVSGGYTGTGASLQNNYYTSETNNLQNDSSWERMDKNISTLCEYLSDPRNRQAVISNDLLLKNNEEMKVMDRLKRV